MVLKRISLQGMVLLICLAGVIALTTLPSSVRAISWVSGLFAIADHPNMHDAIGHASLYALLTTVSYWALRSRFGFRQTFWIALVGGLVIAATTEFIQQFSPGRSMMLSDLLANWLGVMTVAMLISYRRAGMHSTRDSL